MLVTELFSGTTHSHFLTAASYLVFLLLIYLFTAGAPSVVLAAIPPAVLPSTAAAALSSPHVIPVMNMGPGCPPRNGECLCHYLYIYISLNSSLQDKNKHRI